MPESPLPEHLRAAIEAGARQAARQDAARQEAVVARLVALQRLSADPDVQLMEADDRAALEALREALERPQAEAETIYLRGQIAMLRQVLGRPAALRAELAALEETLRESPAAGPEQHRREDGP